MLLAKSLSKPHKLAVIINEQPIQCNLPTQATANLRNPESDRKELAGFIIFVPGNS
jgi:hypothetical protein